MALSWTDVKARLTRRILLRILLRILQNLIHSKLEIFWCATGKTASPLGVGWANGSNLMSQVPEKKLFVI